MNRLLVFVMLFIPFVLYAQKKAMSVADLSRELEAAMKIAAGQNEKKDLGNTYGKIAAIYLQVAKLPPNEIKADNFVFADKKANLNKSIEYSEQSIAASTDAGDIEQLKISYKNLHTAQRMAGKMKESIATYAKLTSLKNNIFGSKKANEIEKKQLEYENAKRIDSLRNKQKMAEEALKAQGQTIEQQQQQLLATNKTLSVTEREKEHVSKALQKTQQDLSVEKSKLEEKEKQLTLSAQEKALLDANMQVQQAKQKLLQNELLLKDSAIEQQKTERYFYIFGCLALLTIAIIAFRSFSIEKKSNLALLKEKKRSEELLLNILPAEVAVELMEKGTADAKLFSNVTVLFTDFVSFTSIAETMTPQQLVGELHICFKAFDEILGKYRIEKIKTVGDAYMAVAGLPGTNPNHAEDVVAAAIEIRNFMTKRKEQMGLASFNVRIGINSGEVVAGIVGVRKFSYDIWGDTVNVAARMEQNSEDGKINISETTYQMVKAKYPCTHRGKIEAKNKGTIDMYYVTA